MMAPLNFISIIRPVSFAAATGKIARQLGLMGTRVLKNSQNLNNRKSFQSVWGLCYQPASFKLQAQQKATAERRLGDVKQPLRRLYRITFYSFAPCWPWQDLSSDPLHNTITRFRLQMSWFHAAEGAPKQTSAGTSLATPDVASTDPLSQE